MDKPVVRDAALLFFRVIVGLIFIVHGWHKLMISGITKTTGQFSAWGVPQPKLSAWVSGLAETVGGAMLVIGILATFAATGLALLMAAAIYFVHLGAAGFTQLGVEGGNSIEFPLLLLISLAMIVVFGPGRASVDGVLSRA
ncbi:DoxX family membrane protein [Corynebacterium poyangense]|uniref:DoxX family membrane protein n=1 Tax=Corynebacterium poyangense TaxID=2684405 RepID=A0A7H0SMW6_9CORY|nr:DoxX family protein [Corynebacterium poyangense]MBZ8176277.1 DoxX family membrane protein [Corynebacterium poyangense]QNQ89891.1 DoxX family membrane protein [Corynebacterium poyangense]